MALPTWKNPTGNPFAGVAGLMNSANRGWEQSTNALTEALRNPLKRQEAKEEKAKADAMNALKMQGLEQGIAKNQFGLDTQQQSFDADMASKALTDRATNARIRNSNQTYNTNVLDAKLQAEQRENALFARNLFSNPEYQTTDAQGNTSLNMDAIQKAYGNRPLEAFNTSMDRYKTSRGIDTAEASAAKLQERQHEMDKIEKQNEGKTDAANIRAKALKSGKGGDWNIPDYILEGLDPADAMKLQMQAKQYQESGGVTTDAQGRPTGMITANDWLQELANQVGDEQGFGWPNWNQGDIFNQDVLEGLQGKKKPRRKSRSNASQ